MNRCIYFAAARSPCRSVIASSPFVLFRVSAHFLFRLSLFPFFVHIRILILICMPGMPPAAPSSPTASAKHKSSYAAAATTSATSTGPVLSYHAHPLTPRSSITISREGSPSPRTSTSALHRPTFVHATTSYAVAAAAGSSAAGSSSASGHGSRGESRGGSAKPYSEDEGYRKEVSAYYPPEFPHSHGPYPYPHHQYTPFSQPDRLDAETSVLDRLRTAVRKMFGGNDSRESKLACLQCSNSEEGGELGRAMMFGWVITTVGFFLAIAFWRGELFRGKLDTRKQTVHCMALTLLA